MLLPCDFKVHEIYGRIKHTILYDTIGAKAEVDTSLSLWKSEAS